MDHIRALIGQYSYRRPVPVRGVHLSGKKWVPPDTRVELTLRASVCGNLSNQGSRALKASVAVIRRSYSNGPRLSGRAVKPT